MSTEAKTKAKRIQAVVDVKVIADIGLSYSRWHRDMEDYAKDLEREAKDFVAHCRDHRSLDHLRLDVERVFQEQCSECKQELEIVNDPETNDGRPSCAYCGTEIEP